MKAIHAFEEHKFRSLSPTAQEKALTRILTEIERHAWQGVIHKDLIENLRRMITWMPDAGICSDELEPEEPRLLALKVADLLRNRQAPLRDHDIMLRTVDGSPEGDPSSLARARQIVVILADLRSAFNVGSIFRSAECLGIGEVWLGGITARPDEDALKKTARDTISRVNWRSFESSLEAIFAAKQERRIVYALETAEDAQSVFEVDFELPCALVLGNEALGIADAELKACDQIIALPVLGWKNSLNVGVAFGVCAYQMVFGKKSTKR